MRKYFYLLLFVFFFLLYAATAQRGVSWQDSGEFQWRILSGDLRWFAGLARAHPLYLHLATLFNTVFPASAFFFSTHLLSAVGMAGAATLIALLVALQTHRRTCGVLAALLFGLSHMPWWLGTIAEVDAWGCLFLALELLGLRWALEKQTALPWLLLAFLNGLDFSLHNIALLNIPILLIACPPRYWLGCLAVWCVGCSPILYLLPHEIKVYGIGGGIKSLLFGYDYAHAVLGTTFKFKMVLASYALFSINLMNPAWFTALRPLWREKGSFSHALRGLLLIHALFFLRYFIPSQALFSTTTLLLLSVWAGLGASYLSQRVLLRLSLGSIVCSITVPILLLFAVDTYHLFPNRQRALPFRKEARYWLLPWKHNETSAQQFVDHIGKLLHDTDVLIADPTIAGPLMAAQKAGALSTGWRLITPWSGETDDMLKALVGSQQRIFVLSPIAGYTPAVFLNGSFRFEKEDILYRVRSVHHE